MSGLRNAHRTGTRIDRRTAVAALAGTGLSLASIGFDARPAHAADDLMCIDWTNYHVPEMMPEYVAKHGAVPPVTYMVDDEDAFQKLRAGFQADTVHPNTFSVPRYRDGGVARPIDTSRLSRWPELFDAVKQVPGVMADGQAWIVPCSWGNSSIIYRTDLVDPKYQEEPSWTLLWDERYKGRLAASSPMEDVVISAGLVAGAKDPFAMTDEELATVGDLLRKQRDNLRFYWEDMTTMEQAMASGEIVAAIAWNTSVSSLKREGVPVAYMTPKEGILTWLDGLVWSATGEGPEEKVYDLMNAWLDPEAGKYLIDVIGYGHTNPKSFELVSPERIAEAGYTDPLASLSSGVFFQPIEPKLRERYNNLLEEIKAGN
jgi:spermidine/putrescine transport system substrate-binding protein